MESKWYVTYSDGDLVHHGVKGMKWGVRHDPKPGSSYNKNGSSYSSNNKSGSAYTKPKKTTGYMPSNIKKSGKDYKDNSKSGLNYDKNGKLIRPGRNNQVSTYLIGGGSVEELNEIEEILNGVTDINDLTEDQRKKLINVLLKIKRGSELANNNVFDALLKNDPGFRSLMNKSGSNYSKGGSNYTPNNKNGVRR